MKHSKEEIIMDTINLGIDQAKTSVQLVERQLVSLYAASKQVDLSPGQKFFNMLDIVAGSEIEIRDGISPKVMQMAKKYLSTSNVKEPDSE